MKRLLIWLFILISPVSFWFAFTDDGNDAFQMWFGEANNNSMTFNSTAKAIVTDSIKLDSASVQNKRILIPAHRINKNSHIPQPPYLRVVIKGQNTAYRKAAAGLLLVDKDGRRTGYDPINNKLYQEIPNSKYQINTERTSATMGVAIVSVKPVAPEYFRLEVFAHQDSTYNLAVSRSPSPRSRILMVTPMGHGIKKGELHSYLVNMSNNPKSGFFGSMAEEPMSASFRQGRNVKTEAINSADMKLDLALPVLNLHSLQQQAQPQIYLDEDNQFSLLHSGWNGIYFGKGDNSVLMKVLPHSQDSFHYYFNKTFSSLQSFAAIALPRSIGLSADGDSYGIHPVGIYGTKTFTNANGVKGIQTYVAHEERRFEEGDEKPYISYALQGPVYLFDLKPGQQVSPVLVLSPSKPIGFTRTSEPQRVWDMANSVKLLP